MLISGTLALDQTVRRLPHHPLQAHLSCALTHHYAEPEFRPFCSLGIASRYTTGENSDHHHQGTSGPHEAHDPSSGASPAILGLGPSLTIVIATACGYRLPLWGFRQMVLPPPRSTSSQPAASSSRCCASLSLRAPRFSLTPVLLSHVVRLHAARSRRGPDDSNSRAPDDEFGCYASSLCP